MSGVERGGLSVERGVTGALVIRTTVGKAWVGIEVTLMGDGVGLGAVGVKGKIVDAANGT
jgi:hypothetical protein